MNTVRYQGVRKWSKQQPHELGIPEPGRTVTLDVSYVALKDILLETVLNKFVSIVAREVMTVATVNLEIK